MSEKFEELIDRHLNDELQDIEKLALAEELDTNPEARKKLVTESELTSAIISALEPESKKNSPKKFNESKNGLKLSVLKWVLAAAAILVVLLNIQWKSPKPIETETVVVPSPATLVNEAGARFEGFNKVEDIEFKPGTYNLQEGSIQLHFNSGADMVVEAPAVFNILDQMSTRVFSGKYRTIVPPAAKGFTLKTDYIIYEDLGTEFAVKVTDKSSEIHVISGEVNVIEKSTEKILNKVFQGNAYQYNPNSQPVEIEFEPDHFLNKSQVGYQRWNKQVEKQIKEKDILANYSFVQDESNYLKNSVTGSIVGDGYISGARWVTGRWRGKKALLFDRESDFVEFDIPYEMQEISISVWLKVERLDTRLSPIFNSNNWDPGDIHLQLMQNSGPHFDIYGSGVTSNKKVFTKEPLDLTDWINLVVVLSSKENFGKIYVNGQPYYESKFVQNAIIKPGKCRLGNWVPVPGFEPRRTFVGKIDELTIWKRTLSSSEVMTLVKKGRPSVEWSGDH